MRTIRFNPDDPGLEEALRLITFNGPVVHTGTFGVYRVPDDILTILDQRGIAYDVVKAGKNGNSHFQSLE